MLEIGVEGGWPFTLLQPDLGQHHALSFAHVQISNASYKTFLPHGQHRYLHVAASLLIIESYREIARHKFFIISFGTPSPRSLSSTHSCSTPKKRWRTSSS